MLTPGQRTKLSQDVTAWELEAKRIGAAVTCEWAKHWSMFMMPLSVVALREPEHKRLATIALHLEDDGRLVAEVTLRAPVHQVNREKLKALMAAWKEVVSELAIDWTVERYP